MTVDASSPPTIYSLAVELTTRCNLRCPHCYNPSRDDPKAQEIPLEESGDSSAQTRAVVARLIKILDTIRVGHVTLTGGEPLSFPGLDSVLALLQERGVPTQMISNAALVTDAVAAQLERRGVRSLQATLHAPTAAEHDAHTGVRSFDRTLAGIRMLQTHGIPAVGCIVITKRNAARVGETLSVWQSLGVQRVALSRFSPAGYASRFTAALLPTRAELITAFSQALVFARDESLRLFSTMPLPPCAFETEDYRPIRFGSCAIGTTKQEFALGPGGDLRNCTLHRTAIGGVTDILEDGVDLAALIESNDVVGYRKQVPAFCEGCLYANTCGGGCGAASEWVLGDARKTPDPFVWQHIDDDFAARLEHWADTGEGAELTPPSHSGEEGTNGTKVRTMARRQR